MADNTAYNLDIYAQKRLGTSATPKVKQPPELRVIKNRQLEKNRALFKGATTFILVLAVVSAVLYNKMLLTELTSEIEQAQSTYAMLKNDNKLLEMELEGKTSLRTVQEAAEDTLGMARIESYQIQYLDLGESHGVQHVADAKQSFTDKIYEIYNSLLEYLGF